MSTYSDDQYHLDRRVEQFVPIGYMDESGIKIAGREWDASKGTNPETCRHWVLRKYIGYLKYNWFCYSCNGLFVELPFDRKLEEYRYEPVYDAWEFIRKGIPNPVPNRGLLEAFLGQTLFDWQWELLVHVLNKSPIEYRGRRF